jgi:TatD DNase family protein
MYIDIHCHIETYKDIGDVIDRARSAGVKAIVNNSIDFKSMKKTIALAEWFSEVKTALGVGPIESLKLDNKGIEEIIDFIRKNKDKIIAIGEVGIDLKWSSDFEGQKKYFIKFVELALELDLPLIVHSRKAEKEVIEILEEKGCKKVIMHCFTGGMKLCERVVKNGWYISIPTNVVYNSQVQDIAKKVPLQNLFCETDCPYFNPFHDKRNEPCFIVEGYKKIAEIKGLETEEVEEQIEENFRKLFNQVREL